MLFRSTGCVEIKSGYGLTTEDELKILRVAQRVKAHSPKKLLALSYITSVVKCGTSQTINAKAIAECFPRLQREIARVEPSMFITYGKDPYFIISGGKAFPKGGEGIDILPNGKIHIYTMSLEYMRKNNDYSYLDRAYDTAVIAYRKFVNQWVILK